MKDKIAKHSHLAWPEEACGFVLTNGAVVACTNIAPDPVNEFQIDPAEASRYWTAGQVAAVWHSHPADGCEPSGRDEEFANAGVDFYIYSLPEAALALYRPERQRLRLVSIER